MDILVEDNLVNHLLAQRGGEIAALLIFAVVIVSVSILIQQILQTSSLKNREVKIGKTRGAYRYEKWLFNWNVS
jgi:hypothetical protein